MRSCGCSGLNCPPGINKVMLILILLSDLLRDKFTKHTWNKEVISCIHPSGCISSKDLIGLCCYGYQRSISQGMYFNPS